MVRRIAIIGVLLAGGVALGGCEDKGKDALKAYKAKVCACKDAACVAALDPERVALAGMKTSDPDGAAVLRDEIVACIAKVGQ